jgi:hypothetical protein
VKRLLALVVGVFGIRALLRRRSQPALTYGGSPSPAEDLKARLAETRSSVPESDAPESTVSDVPESTVSESAVSESAEPAEPTVDEKRVDVHNRARGAIDELKS